MVNWSSILIVAVRIRLTGGGTCAELFDIGFYFYYFIILIYILATNIGNPFRSCSPRPVPHPLSSLTVPLFADCSGLRVSCVLQQHHLRLDAHLFLLSVVNRKRTFFFVAYSLCVCLLDKIQKSRYLLLCAKEVKKGFDDVEKKLRAYNMMHTVA